MKEIPVGIRLPGRRGGKRNFVSLLRTGCVHGHELFQVGPEADSGRGAQLVAREDGAGFRRSTNH